LDAGRRLMMERASVPGIAKITTTVPSLNFPSAFKRPSSTGVIEAFA
jgi:hypothetical protein